METLICAFVGSRFLCEPMQLRSRGDYEPIIVQSRSSESVHVFGRAPWYFKCDAPCGDRKYGDGISRHRAERKVPR